MGAAGSERDDATSLTLSDAAAKNGQRGRAPGSPLEVLRVFFKLGVSAFGGRWLSSHDRKTLRPLQHRG